MTDEVFSRFYCDSGQPVSAGDLVWIDGHPAEIVEVFPPGSPEAEVFGCASTGGFFVRYEDHGGAKALEKFGSYGSITRRQAGL